METKKLIVALLIAAILFSTISPRGTSSRPIFLSMSIDDNFKPMPKKHVDLEVAYGVQAGNVILGIKQEGEK